MITVRSLPTATSFPLEGCSSRLGAGFGTDYAQVLLTSLGAEVTVDAASEPFIDPQRLWAESGAMWLTGCSNEPPLCSPVPVAVCAHGALQALSSLSAKASLPDAGKLLGERAAIAGYGRQGAVAPGGACRLLSTRNGALAVNLPRAEDWELLPAWLEGGRATDWGQLAQALAQRDNTALLASAVSLGLAVAPVDGGSDDTSWFRVAHTGTVDSAQRRMPRVIDLSALWAGPLCGHLFSLLGAEVIKVESWQRPDGARHGPSAFYSLMNAGKASVALDLGSKTGLNQLRALILSADIVIESSRPRALRQMGLWAEELIDTRPGLTWVSITGYGRDGEQGNRVAYGDDAGVGGGLSAALRTAGHGLLFCGDAIADPLTGLHSALAGWASWQAGGGRLLDIALCQVVRHCTRQPLAASAPVERTGNEWQVLIDRIPWPVARPSARGLVGRARALGSDNDRVLGSLAALC